jgi:hypothetical protein
MLKPLSESIFSWLSFVGATVPPREPNDDEDEEDDEDGGDADDDREPAVIRGGKMDDVQTGCRG